MKTTSLVPEESLIYVNLNCMILNCIKFFLYGSNKFFMKFWKTSAKTRDGKSEKVGASTVMEAGFVAKKHLCGATEGSQIPIPAHHAD